MLYHRTLPKNVESIMRHGLVPSGAFVSLSEKADSWYNDLPLFEVDIDSFMKDFPGVRVTTWKPKLDEVCVWANIPTKYLRYIGYTQHIVPCMPCSNSVQDAR